MDKDTIIAMLLAILFGVVAVHLFVINYTYEDIIIVSSNVGDDTYNCEIVTKDWRGHIIEVHNETVEVEKIIEKYRD